MLCSVFFLSCFTVYYFITYLGKNFSCKGLSKCMAPYEINTECTFLESYADVS